MLEKLKASLGESPKDTKDENQLKTAAVYASKMIDRACSLRHRDRKFFPTLETKSFDDPGTQWPNNATNTAQAAANPFVSGSGQQSSACDTLDLFDDLLESHVVMTNNGAAEIPSTAYRLVQVPYPAVYRPPFHYLTVDTGQGTRFQSQNPAQANTITGYWGYHDRWEDAWYPIDTVQNDPTFLSSETSLTVSDVEGKDSLGIEKWADWGALLKIGNDPTTAEMIFVQRVESGNNHRLGVVRGVNGTTAADWGMGEQIYLYQPMEEIVYAAQLLSAWQWRRQRSVGKDRSDQPILTSAGVTILPSSAPSEVKEVIKALGLKKRPFILRGTTQRGGSEYVSSGRY